MKGWLLICGLSLMSCLLFLPEAAFFAQEAKTADVQLLFANFQAEHERVLKGRIDQVFTPLLLEKAQGFASRGQAALKSGDLRKAAEAFRQARWQLPYLPTQTPKHVSRVLGNLRLRHAHEVQAVAYSPDGTKLASASRDQTVKIWDVGNGHELLTYTGHTEPLLCVAFSPDGKKIATGGRQRQIKIWDPSSGKDFITIKGEGAHTNSLLFSRDGKYLIAAHTGGAGQSEGMLAIYDAADGNLKRNITDFRRVVNAVASNTDGTIISAAVADGLVRLWQYPAFVEKPEQPEYWSLQDPNGAAYTSAFTPDNRTLARLGADGIKLYDLPQPGKPFQISAPRRTIGPLPPPSHMSCLSFSNDGTTLYTGGADGLIRLWDTESGQQNGSFKAHGGEIRAIVTTPRRNQIASASADYTIRLWDFGTGIEARDFKGHEGPVWTSAFNRDGRRIVSAGADHTIRVWDATTGKTLLTLAGHDSAVTIALFSPDDKMIVSGGGDKRIKLWDAANGKLLRDLEGHGGAITALDISQDGQRIVSGSADKTVRVWEMSTGKPLLLINDNKSIVGGIAFSPNGKQIAVGNVDQTIQLYDAATGKRQSSWHAHASAVSGLAYSPDSLWLVSCGLDQRLRVWPVATPGKNPITLDGHTGPISAVAFRADSKHVISCGSDQTVRLWKIENGGGKELQSYRGHQDWVTSASFSRDGYHVVSSGVDRVVKVWDINLRDIPILSEHTGSIDAVAYSPDGQLLATGGSDKTIKLWDRKTGSERFTLAGHDKGIQALGFTPDGKTLISSSEDCSIRFWDSAFGKELPRPPGQQRSFTAMAVPVPYFLVAPDGKKLIMSESRERGTVLSGFDLATGTQLFSVNDQGREVNAVAFTVDCKWAATGALDGSVRIIELDKKVDLVPDGHWFLYQKGVALGDIAFSPDGTLLLAGSDTGEIKICLVAKKETLKTIKAHDSRVLACQVSPDGKRFASVDANNLVKVWDLASATELRSWNLRAFNHELRVVIMPIAFSPDGKQLAVGNANTTAFLLDLP